MYRTTGVAIAVVATLLAAPAAAQFSDAYNFLKAVRDKDGAKANELIGKPGNTIVDTRDLDTGETALMIATKRGDIAWMGFALQNGANPNIRDRENNTPLIAASVSRFAEGVRLLIAFKAQLDMQNRVGETALLKAVQNRDIGTTKQLIEAGASPDVGDNSGLTARAAAENDPRNAPIARLLKDIAVRKPAAMQGPR